MAVRKVEQEIERLNLLREAPQQEAAPELAKALGDRVNLIVAKAARIAGERGLGALVPDLLRAFDRLFGNAAQRDPQCWGKNAIAQALVALGHCESAPYARGVRHVQLEPVWGGQADTATTLRGTCVLALAACPDIRREDVLRLMVDALADPSDPVRVEAARALAQMGGEESALLLRLKARVGDPAPQVAGQVFDALLALEREGAVAFVASFLKHGDEAARAEAALSLGSSRLADAVEALLECWETARDPDLRQAVLRGLAVSRLERALEFLLDLVRNARVRDACAAIEALSVDRDSEEIRKRVELAAADREPEVRQALRGAGW
jgi:HEAT repeat protein